VQDVFPLDAPAGKRLWNLRTRARASVPSLTECGLAAASVVLLILSFPDFNLWPLAWVGFMPLMVALVYASSARQAFLLSWWAATLFFYGTCYWLTHAMVHYGNIPRPLAYLLLVPGAMIVGLFPALWGVVFVRLRLRAGLGRALLVAPFAWTALELARLGVSGQLWNAVGYSQAYVPVLVQPARWGGVYAVGFLIVTINAALTFLILRRSVRALLLAATTVGAVAAIIFFSQSHTSISPRQREPGAVVVAVQPNVSANFGRSLAETEALVNRHLVMSERALREWDEKNSYLINNAAETDRRADSLTEAADSGAYLRQALPRVVVWPESPMNFTYATDAQFRETVARFALAHRTSVLFNSLEPAPAGGVYNSAVLINEEGRLVAQYDKIRLLPFGEYVPLPRWLPLTWLLTGIVGEFTSGDKYPLMPLGNLDAPRAGVFICIESAFPGVARTFAKEGADVLVNISNDGYLGRTPVMRQHLANVVFRAVETGRPVLRVTNTGISALVTTRGEVLDATVGFEPATRTWTVGRATTTNRTFYTHYGDAFAGICLLATLASLATTFTRNQIRNIQTRREVEND